MPVLKEAWVDGVIDSNTLIWGQGLADIIPIRNVRTLVPQIRTVEGACVAAGVERQSRGVCCVLTGCCHGHVFCGGGQASAWRACRAVGRTAGWTICAILGTG